MLSRQKVLEYAGMSFIGAIVSVLFVLFSTLFCGFIVNIPTLRERGAWFGASSGFGPQYLSYLFYLNELVLSDEMLGQTVTIKVSPPPCTPLSVSRHAPRLKRLSPRAASCPACGKLSRGRQAVRRAAGFRMPLAATSSRVPYSSGRVAPRPASGPSRSGPAVQHLHNPRRGGDGPPRLCQQLLASGRAARPCVLV